MDKKFMNDVKISYHRDPVLELVTHRAVGRAPEPLRRIGLWIINGSVEWPSQRNGYELVKKRRFGFYSLSQMVGGAGFFSPEGDDSRRVKLKAGDVIVVCPGDIHRYGGTSDSVYLEDSLRFSGALADRMRDVGLLKTGVYHWGAMRTLREALMISGFSLSFLVMERMMASVRASCFSSILASLSAPRLTPGIMPIRLSRLPIFLSWANWSR